MAVGLLASQAIWILPGGVFQQMESLVMDRMLTWRRASPGKPPSKIAVCVMAKESRTRSRLAELVRYLDDAGAEVVAVALPWGDLAAVPGEPVPGELAASFERANVVLGFDFREPEGPRRSREADTRILKSSMVVDRTSGQVRFRQPRDFTPSPEALALAARSQAFLDLPTHGGVARYAYLILAFEGSLYPSLALSAVQAARREEGPITVSPRFFASLPRLTIGDREVQIDPEGKLWIHYLGPARTFTLHDADDLLDIRPADDRFRDRIVFVGLSAADRQTPFPQPMTEVEIHAHVAASLLAEDYVHAHRPRDLVASLLVTLAIGPLVGYLVATRGMAGVGLAVLATLVAWPAVSLAVFRLSGSHWIVLWPVLAGLLALVASGVLQGWIAPRPAPRPPSPLGPPEVVTAPAAETDDALALWRERLEALQKAQALATEADEIFRLKKQVEEARAMLRELGG